MFILQDAIGYAHTEEVSGVGKCPYDPNHNSTFVYAGKS